MHARDEPGNIIPLALSAVYGSTHKKIRHSLSSFDFEQLHLENQYCIGSNIRIGSFFSISKVSGNIQLPLGALRHQLECFSPPCDEHFGVDAIRFIAFVSAIEFGAIDEPGAIMHFHFILYGRFVAAFPLADYPVLQATLGDYHSLSLGV